MKKFVSAVLAAALMMTMTVSGFAASSSTAESGSGVQGIVVNGTSSFTADEKTVADNMVAEQRSYGATAYVFDIDGSVAGNVTVLVPTPEGCTVTALKYHAGAWVNVPVVSYGGGAVTLYMDGAFCPVVVSVHGGTASTSTAGTSPKTGLY